MTLAFYMDHHVPNAVTAGLRRRGVEVLTAHEDNHGRAADTDLLARATSLGRILFSQDDDLLAVAAAWQVSGRPFAGVIYSHQLRATIGQLVTDMELMARVLDREDMYRQVQFLPL